MATRLKPPAAGGATPAAPLRWLRAGAAVADHGSAARAAPQLHLSVSAVTRAVQQAETRLGVPLFERGARGMACTPAGAALVLRVQRALGELARGQAAVATLTRHGPGPAWRLDDPLLHALVVVAQTRSQVAAARQLGLSQPALQQALARLQHATRATLFEHTWRGTRLTEAGEALLQAAKLALLELRLGHEALAAFCGGGPGSVVVGALPMSSDVLVPQALSRLFSSCPGVVATVVDGTYEALLLQLRLGDVDCVVGPLRGAAAAADVVEDTLFTDDLLPVVRAGHPLLQGLPPRRLCDLLAWPWIGPLPGTPARTAFERAFREAGLDVPAVGLQVNSPAVVRSVLMAGDQVALLSPLQIRGEVSAGQLVLLPVPVRGTQRAIGITQRRDGLASLACQTLVAELRTVAQLLVSPGI
ncbi:MAG: LysR family transcriptional regulator [Rubrivivax sp.]